MDELNDERVMALEKKARMMKMRNGKDEKLLKMQKKLFDKHVFNQNQRIHQLELILKDKEKEIRLQAIKIKELVYAGTDHHRNAIIKRDLPELQKLASAASPNRHFASHVSASKQAKLEQHR